MDKDKFLSYCDSFLIHENEKKVYVLINGKRYVSPKGKTSWSDKKSASSSLKLSLLNKITKLENYTFAHRYLEKYFSEMIENGTIQFVNDKKAVI